MKGYMDKKEAAIAWGLNVEWVRRILPDVEGSLLVVDGGRLKWMVPIGTPKPTKTRTKKEK